MDETQPIQADEPCKCGRYMLKHWWAAITDAGKEGTDYKRHSREGCLTRTERDRERAELADRQRCPAGTAGSFPYTRCDQPTGHAGSHTGKPFGEGGQLSWPKSS